MVWGLRHPASGGAGTQGPLSPFPPAGRAGAALRGAQPQSTGGRRGAPWHLGGCRPGAAGHYTGFERDGGGARRQRALCDGAAAPSRRGLSSLRRHCRRLSRRAREGGRGGRHGAAGAVELGGEIPAGPGALPPGAQPGLRLRLGRLSAGGAFGRAQRGERGCPPPPRPS